jgi:quercetin dioxygenase-like cupin family protein
MRTKLGIAVVFVLGILVGHLTTPVALSQYRTVKRTQLLTTDLGGWCDGKEVTVELNDIDPGTSGKHYHPAHSFTYVLQGTEVYTVEGLPTKTVHAGDVLHEAPNQVHTVENLGQVKLLVVRVAEKGKEATVRLP